jgi:chromosomal replication initiator protein
MNKATLWQDLLVLLTEEVGSRVVETWFKAISFSRWDAESRTVYMSTPNPFVRDWVSSQYYGLLKTHLSRLLNTTVTLAFIDEKSSSLTRIEKDKRIGSTSLAKAPQSGEFRSQMQSRYGFDSYVVGEHNAVAVAAAQAVAENPGTLYNPFFITGGSGMGKTHLLQAIGNQIKQTNPQAKVVYQSADRFVHEFVNAIRSGKMKSFEERYKDVDVLLVDDIQMLSHKEQTQGAFFHIFTTLHDKGKQIIFASDVLPGHIEGLSERLKSRLNGSLIADIQPASLATKVAIVQRKALLQQAPLQEEVATLIASKSSSNIRELEGLLIRVLAFAALTHQVLTCDVAHTVLARTAALETKQTVLGLPYVASCVAKHFHTSIAELRSTKRQKTLVDARHVAMYCMKKYTEHSLRDIAAYWCRKDHTTVIHAIAKIEKVRLTDALLDAKMKLIDRELGRS